MCEVPETFYRVLLEISTLRTLCIWPDTFSEYVRKTAGFFFSFEPCIKILQN